MLINIIVFIIKQIFKRREIINKTNNNFYNIQTESSYKNIKNNKKTILILDHGVPKYDRDAGSRTVWMYIDLFIEMGFNVKIIPDDFIGANPYTDGLERKGVEILYGAYYKKNYDKWIIDNATKIDLVFINRPFVAFKYIAFLKKYIKKKIFYYGMDMQFVREYEWYKIIKKRKFLAKSKYFKAIEQYVYNLSDVLLTISEKEKVLFYKMGYKNVQTFPVYYYKKINIDQNIRDNSIRKNILFVGSIHAPNIDAMKWFIRDIFPIVKKTILDIKLIVVGQSNLSFIDNNGSNDIICKQGISDLELELIYRTTKVVIVPLRFGAGVKGKVVEAIYNQVPVVSTDFGIEGLNDITNIIEAKNTKEEFANEVIRLYMLDEKRYKQIQDKYGEYIRRYFSFDKAKQDINNIINCN